MMIHGNMMLRSKTLRHRMQHLIFLLILFFLLIALLPESNADLIINSKDWKDVYTALLYAKLANDTGYFVTSSDAGELSKTLFPLLKSKQVTYIESKTQPLTTAVKPLLLTTQKDATEITYDNDLNLELIDLLPHITKFMLVDDSLPYNAIPIVPYATLENYYVFFVNSNNVEAVFAKLSNRTVTDLFVYSNLEPAVKEKLKTTSYQPKVINTGDKYNDNLDMLRLFYETQNQDDAKQLALYDGFFLDADLFHIKNPVLLMQGGKLPERVEKFVLNSPTKSVITAHPSLTPYASYFHRKLGYFSVVKIGYATASGDVNFGYNELGIFLLPAFNNNMTIEKVQYNSYSHALQVHYKNSGDVYNYFTAARHAIMVPKTSQQITSFADKDVYYIQEKEKKIILYPDIDLGKYKDEQLLLVTDLVYGSDSGSVDIYNPINTTIEFIDYRDDSAIEIASVVYDKEAQAVEVTIKNKGSDTVFADATILNLIINDVPTSVSSEITPIFTAQQEKLIMPANLTQDDIDKNKKINLEVRYGQADDELVKVVSKEFDFELKKDYTWLIILIIILLLIGVVYYFVSRRKRM